MSNLIREAILGQIIRFVTRNKYLQYPEERPDFQLPESFAKAIQAAQQGFHAARDESQDPKLSNDRIESDSDKFQKTKLMPRPKTQPRGKRR